MAYIDLEERPDLARAQVSELENVVEVDRDGNPAFYVAISQQLNGSVGWLSTPPRPAGSGTDLEAILERVWDAFNAQRECRSLHTMQWHVYRLEGRRSWMVQKFEIFRDDAVLLDFEEWSAEQDAKKAAEAKEEDIRERRAGMKVVSSEVP